MYYGARYYDPWVGRFLSQDPDLVGPVGGMSFAGIAANPGNFNAYTYALNAPTVYTDPTGRFTIQHPSTLFTLPENGPDGISGSSDGGDSITLGGGEPGGGAGGSSGGGSGGGGGGGGPGGSGVGGGGSGAPAVAKAVTGSDMSRSLAVTDGTCVDCTPANREAYWAERPFDASQQVGFGMIWDAPTPPPISRADWDAAWASCDGCTVTIVVLGGVVALPAANALALRGAVALGPMAYQVIRHGSDAIRSFSLQGSPPQTVSGVAAKALRTGVQRANNE